MKPKLIIYWSRRDFRLTDNPALFKSIAKSNLENIALLPIFILENYMTAGDPEFQFGYPSQYFLAQALPIFAQNFDNFTIFKGVSGEVFDNLAKEFEIEIFVNEDVHPDFYKQVIKLQKNGLIVNVFNDQLTIDKDTVSGTGNFYSVFSPFKKNIWQQFLDYPEVGISNPQSAIGLDKKTQDILVNVDGIFRFAQDDKVIHSNQLLELFDSSRKIKFGGNVLNLDELIGKPDLSDWYWSENEVLDIFDTYLSSELLSEYKQNRDSLELDTESKAYEVTNSENTPSRGGLRVATKGLQKTIKINGKTSKMSLALAWGLVSARTLKNKVLDYYGQDFSNFHSTTPNQGALCFLSELIWREFYKYIFYHRPEVINTEFQEKYRGTIQWVEHKTALERFESWIKGQTGYPAVDAAMNQLAQTGWMHNRARMMVASILTKNLGVDWRWGQEYFRAVLIDLDEASNNGGWQWGSSTGSDPKPIRIFNPYLQAENYDKSGAYQKKWLPSDYWPDPIVEHKDARSQAMKRYGLNERGAARDF
jgi:deoxyribodipyrimidine photolyase